MKPVLCALDFSESSSSVMRAAFEMAACFKTSVTVLYSYRLVKPANVEIAEYRKSMETKARCDFETLVSKLGVNDSVKYEFRPEIGFLSDRLDVYGVQNRNGVIVMGQDMAASINEHKGESLHDFLKSLKIPLLIVPKET